MCKAETKSLKSDDREAFWLAKPKSEMVCQKDLDEEYLSDIKEGADVVHPSSAVSFLYRNL